MEKASDGVSFAPPEKRPRPRIGRQTETKAKFKILQCWSLPVDTPIGGNVKHLGPVVALRTSAAPWVPLVAVPADKL